MADSSLPLSRLRARLAQPRGKKRMDSLLAADDPGAAVARLSVLELHYLVHDVGFEDALELVALATPEQFRGCLDLDGWDRDQLQLSTTMPWLSALAESGFENVARVWQSLDPEFTALLIARAARVYDLTLEDELPGDDKHPVFLTPDRFFAVEFIDADEDMVAVFHRLIEDLYRADPSGTLARHTLMAARSEPEFQLYEMSYRWRTGRMSDMGYVDYYDALEVYRLIDPASVALEEHTEDRFGEPIEGDPAESESLPVPVAERLVGLSFLSRAMDRIDDADELTRLEMAMLVLINKVLATARVSPGNKDAMGVGAEHALATLSLGLESVSGGDLEAAERALRTISFTRLHRLGYTITAKLSALARALAPRAHTADPVADVTIAALVGRRPMFPTVLGDPPGTDVRPIASMADVRVLTHTLTTLALRIAIVDSLGVDLVAMAKTPEPRPELDDYTRTALVHAMLRHAFVPTPLTLDELDRFRARCLAAGRLSDEACATASQALTDHLERHHVKNAHAFLPELLGDWLARLEAELGQLAGEPDARFIGGILLSDRHD